MNEQEVHEIVDRVVDRLIKERVQPLLDQATVLSFSDAFMPPKTSRAVVANMTPKQQQSMAAEIRRAKERERPLTYSDEQEFIEFCRTHKKKMPEHEARELFRKSADNPGLRDFLDEMRHPSSPQYV